MADKRQQERKMPPPGGPRRGPGGRGMPVEKPKNAKKTMGKLMKYISKSRYILIGLFAVVSVIAVTSIIFPFVIYLPSPLPTVSTSRWSFSSILCQSQY